MLNKILLSLFQISTIGSILLLGHLNQKHFYCQFSCSKKKKSFLNDLKKKEMNFHKLSLFRKLIKDNIKKAIKPNEAMSSSIIFSF